MAPSTSVIASSKCSQGPGQRAFAQGQNHLAGMEDEAAGSAVAEITTKNLHSA